MLRLGGKITAAVAVAVALLALGAWANARALPNRADLAAAVAGADRVVVIPGLLEPRQEDLARAVFEVRGEGEASALMSEIDFVPPAHGLLWSEGFRCACDGQYHLDFHSGAQLLASVGWHEAHIRWRDGPWGDGCGTHPEIAINYSTLVRAAGVPRTGRATSSRGKCVRHRFHL